MSQTPLSDKKQAHQKGKDIEAYFQQFEALNKLLDSGRSFSGNERNCCFLNVAGNRFADVSTISGVDFADDSRGIALTDWDLDGDLDFWMLNRSRPRIRFMRNDYGAKRHFLLIRLIGESCNRDGVGARVEVKQAGSSHVLLKTLRAGDGFSTQSSKWLHFGLADNVQIERVIVHWPGGPSQEFDNLQGDRRYVLTQGSNAPKVVSPPEGRKPLAKTEKIAAKKKPQRQRMGVLGDISLPFLQYRTWDHKLVDLKFPREKPLLLNVWASWCAPCLKELGEFANDADNIQAAGVDILALTIDGAKNLESQELARSQSFIERIKFPFSSGLATADMMKKLQLFQQEFNEDNSTAMPVSLLVTADGRVAAIYSGPLRLDTLFSDVKLVQKSGKQPANLGIPFSGRWHKRPSSLDQLKALASEYGLIKYHRDALRYSRQVLQIDPDSDVQYNFNVASRIVADLENRSKTLSSQVAADSLNPQLHFLLGQNYYRQRKIEEAIRHLEKAVELAPDSAEAQLGLGLVLMSQGDLKTAEIHFQQLLRIEPGHRKAMQSLEKIKAIRNSGT